MRKMFALLVPLLLLSGCRSGQAELEKQNAEILAEMKNLNARLDLLEKQAKQNAGIRPELKKITVRLDRLEKQRRVQVRQTASRFARLNQTGPQLRGINVRPDMTKLSKIRLPANPTVQQIIDYIRQIRQASNGQNAFSSNDPQIAMYEQIGPGHLHLLLPYLTENDRPTLAAVRTAPVFAYITGNDGTPPTSSFHLHLALPKLVGEADKELVRRSLKQYPCLILGVVRNGWIKEMEPEIIAMLKMPDVPRIFELRKCIPELGKSPDLLKIMTDIYINHPDGYFFLSGLKQIPGVGIRNLVTQAWKKALENPSHVNAMIPRAQQVIQDGEPNVEAVKYLLKLLMAGPPRIQTFQMQPNILFLASRCNFPIYDPARLREWYDKNADRIVYDPATGKYVVKK